MSEDTGNATFSRESGDGPTLFDWRESLTIIPSGLDHARVKVFRQLASDKDSKTRDISGRHGFGSSGSAALQLCLENRLKTRFPTDDWILFRETWKRKNTPLRRPYLVHIASARRKSDNDFFSWPTPRANDAEKRGIIADDPRNGLVTAANLCAWSTPSAMDWKDTPGMAAKGENPDGTKRVRLDQLPRQAYMISGPEQNGSGAEMENPGLLNPAFSRWLQGYPKEWDEAAIKVYRSMKTTAKKEGSRD